MASTAEVIELARQNKSPQEIARICRISTDGVKFYLARAGFTTQGGQGLGQQPQQPQQHQARSWEQGTTFYGVTTPEFDTIPRVTDEIRNEEQRIEQELQNVRAQLEALESEYKRLKDVRQTLSSGGFGGGGEGGDRGLQM